MEMSTLDIHYSITNKMSISELEILLKYIKEMIQFKKDCIGYNQAEDAINSSFKKNH